MKHPPFTVDTVVEAVAEWIPELPSHLALAAVIAAAPVLWREWAQELTAPVAEPEDMANLNVAATKPDDVLTAAEAAKHVKLNVRRVRDAAVECARSNGRKGLRGYQRGPNCSWRFFVEDLDRWLRGEPPARSIRRVA